MNEQHTHMLKLTNPAAQQAEQNKTALLLAANAITHQARGVGEILYQNIITYQFYTSPTFLQRCNL